MKQLFITVSIIATITLISCKKDYTCTCTSSVGDVNTYEYKKVKKKDAEKDCKNSEQSYFSQIRQVQVTETCVLN